MWVDVALLRALPPLAFAAPFAAILADEVPTNAWGGWSAFGLAGLILCWLFFRHLPDKDRQLKEKDDHLQAVVKELAEVHAAQDKERRGDFQAALKTVTDHCDKEHMRLIETLKAQGGEMTMALKDVRETLEELRAINLRSGPEHK